MLQGSRKHGIYGQDPIPGKTRQQKLAPALEPLQGPSFNVRDKLPRQGPEDRGPMDPDGLDPQPHHPLVEDLFDYLQIRSLRRPSPSPPTLASPPPGFVGSPQGASRGLPGGL